MHKPPYKSRFIVGQTIVPQIKLVSSLLTRCFQCIKTKAETYYLLSLTIQV